jgi:signal transduction histidine kinase
MSPIAGARASVSTRLTVMVAGILVAAELVSGGISLRAQQRQLRRALETKATSLVTFLAQVVPLSVLSLNFVDMGNAVRNVVLTDGEMVYAVIVNEQRIPLAYFVRPGSPLLAGIDQMPTGGDDRMALLERMKRTGRVLEVSAPILAPDRVGDVVLGLSLDGMRRAVSDQIGTVVLAVCAIVAGSLILLRLVLDRTLRPVRALTDAVAQISAGDLDVAVAGVERSDELGVLSRGFQSMAGQLRELITGLEQRVAARTAELQAVNQELQSFAYSVSHDLRAPLRHVDGFVELLRNQLGTAIDPRTQHCMDAIAESALRMGELVDSLLAFSRMGRSEMSPARVDLGQLLGEVVAELAAETDGREVRWRFGELPAVDGDRAMLRAVLSNLVANALKFTRTRHPAEIEVGSRTSDEGEVVVFVRDNGVGFDPAYAHKLFGVFQRLHRAEDYEGHGIGLANVRRLVGRHGGRAWAEGAVDRGATFFFSLPGARADRPASPSSRSRP